VPPIKHVNADRRAKFLELGSNVAGFAGDGSINIEPADQRENLSLDLLPELRRIVAEHAPESQFEPGILTVSPSASSEERRLVAAVRLAFQPKLRS
jgi:hypothetical protein